MDTKFQEIYDLNRDNDEEIAKLKDDNKRLKMLLDQSNDEVEKQKTVANNLRVLSKETWTKQKAVINDLKVKIKHFEKFAEKRCKIAASNISLEKQLARHKMSTKMVELQQNVNTLEEEKRERIKAAANTVKPALVFAKKCKCGSTTHLRTNHKSCRLNRANVTVRANVV